jgi:U3 small nucleolar RNA-associated protein 6
MRYVEFEKNIDALRRKRIKRMGVRYKGSGQRSIYAIYNRGTKKFSGDLALWMQYIEFARKDKAYKRLNEILTTVVRLHPTKPELWIYAANYFMESQGDITDARSYMQRGLRFCKNSEVLWLEYAKLETVYVGKIAGRRRILGLDVDRTRMPDVDADDDVIALPEVTAEDVNPSLRKEDGVDEVALQNLASAPILTGAIPIAVFDSAMKQFNNGPVVAEKFFEMFAEFDQVPCTRRILQHVLGHLEQTSPRAVETIACSFRSQLFSLRPVSEDFPVALGNALEFLGTAIRQYPGYKTHISEVAIRQILALLVVEGSEDMDPVVQKVLSSRLRKFVRIMEEARNSDGSAVIELAKALQHEGKRSHAQFLVGSSLKQWGTNEEVQQLHSLLNT